MTANIAFALSAAVLSLLVVVGSALKGHWWVAAAYALLVLGFLARAAYGRRRGEPAELPPPGPGHESERRLERARFRRR